MTSNGSSRTQVVGETTGPAEADASGGKDVGMRIVAEMLAGMLLYGGLGWVADHFLGTAFLMPVGLLLGFGLSIYLVIKRFGGAVTR